MPRSLRLRQDVAKRSSWYAAMSNHVASWLLMGRLDVDENNSAPPSGPGCSKSSKGRVATEIHGFLRAVCALEEKRKDESVSRRFRHYLDVVSAYEIEKQARSELATIGREMSMGYF
jgi:hypothetical protein|tara:strand:+ start:123 stop:473 length:351 start_codon:yes stop_codon:yes gene_type:complete